MIIKLIRRAIIKMVDRLVPVLERQLVAQGQAEPGEIVAEWEAVKARAREEGRL